MWFPFHSSNDGHRVGSLELNEEEEFARVWDSEKVERTNPVVELRDFVVQHPLAVVAAVGVGVMTLLLLRRRHRSLTRRAKPARVHQSPRDDDNSTLRAVFGAAASAAVMAAARHLAYRAVAEANDRWIRPA